MTEKTKTQPLPIGKVLMDNLVTLAEAYAEAAGIKITTVGANATKTASFFTDLKSGQTGCTIRKYDLLTAWFYENWPEEKTMPQLVDPMHYHPVVHHPAKKGMANGQETSSRKRSGKEESRRQGSQKGRRESGKGSRRQGSVRR